MWKRISIFTLSLLMSIVVFAQNGELEIRMVNNKEIQLNPGSTFCVAVMLSNYTHSDKEFHLKIRAPKGWNQIMDYSSEEVSASTKKLKIFSFYAPDNARVGDYNIYIDAFDNETNIKIGTAVVQVYIKPKYEILTKTMNPPVYVFSGDTLSVRFLLQNSSNVRTTIRTTVVNNKVSETRDITLPADASQVIRIFVTTQKDIPSYTNATVRISASVVGAPQINSNSSCTFKIIPSEKVKFDAYNRIPVRISGLFATNNPNGASKYGYMFDIQGGGVLTPGKDKRLYFQLKGPNRQGNPVLGQTDEYYVRYETAHSKVVVGDNSFGLTPLTEASRLGRGVSYEHEFKKIKLGGFVNFPRFYPSLKRVISANGGFFSGEKFRLNLGFLTKTFVTNSSTMLMTVSGGIMPFSWNDIKFEFATGSANGKTAKAYTFDFKIHHKPFNLFVDYTRADPNFPGYLSNTEFVSSGANITLFKKLSLSANYFFNHTNMALDTMYSNAPYSKSMMFSMGYRFSINNSVSLSVNKSTMEDMSTPKLFYYSDLMTQLTVTSRIKRIEINVYGSYGKTTNYLTPRENELATKTVLNTNFSVRYKVNNHINFSSFVSYLGGQQFINSSFKRYLYGGTMDANWGAKFKMSLQYQNNYSVQELYKNRSLVGFNASYRLSKHDQISAYLNYGLKSNQLNKTQIAASLNLTHTLNAPSSKRKDVGNVHGKIINNGVDNINGLRISMAGNVLYTDKNGEFNFQNVRIGPHYLFVDVSTAGYNAIAEKPGPYKIEVLPGKTVDFKIALTKAGEIKGKVEVKKDKALTDKGYISVKKELKPLIVEVNDGNEVFRTYTSSNGTFQFTDLRPGLWKVKVYNKGIPDGYQLETSEFNINLASKEVKFVNVVVKKIYHKIQFQQSSW